jgi:glycosyltransferase involved in cell wall biosynthesis
MKILQLCKKFPYPLKDGESIAVTYLAKALAALGSEISLLSMNTSKHKCDLEQLPNDFNHYKQIHTVDIDNHIKPLDAFLNLFTQKSYHIQRYISADFEQKLISILQKEQFDIIQLETLYLAPYIDTIRKYSAAKIVMRSHNVEYEIWKRVTQNTKVGAKKWYLNLLTTRLRQFEVSYLNRYDMLVAITQRDLDYFKHLGANIPAQVSPIGLDLDDYPNDNPGILDKNKLNFGFIGSLDWMPNTEGLDWLLNQVWDKVLAQAPNAFLHIAGRNTPDWLTNGVWKNVQVHGEVPNAVDFIRKNTIMLVPLLSGGGMRVKILEAMGLGRLVISTALGLEGISAQNGESVLVADSPEAFAEAILRCTREPEMVKLLSQKAAIFVKNHYSNLQIARELLNFYHSQTINSYSLTVSS